MGISKFISKIAVQTAVYWGSPVNDGYGTKTFAQPRELTPPNGVRWTDKQRVVYSAMGEQWISKAEVLVTEDLDLLGWLYLGSLNDFESGVDISDPMKVLGAFEITAFDKIPMIKSTTEFVRKAILKA